MILFLQKLQDYNVTFGPKSERTYLQDQSQGDLQRVLEHDCGVDKFLAYNARSDPIAVDNQSRGSV